VLNIRFANNESSEVVDILLPVTCIILTLRPGLIVSKTSDDSLLASGSVVGLVIPVLGESRPATRPAHSATQHPALS